MRTTRPFLFLCAIALNGTSLSAQLTLINSAPLGPRYATTTGTAHSIDTSNFQIGSASCARAAGPSNASYLSTGIPIDPDGGSLLCPTADKGYTIQFWYRPSSPTTFSYLFGDGAWVGANGQFRCFQGSSADAGCNTGGPAGNLRIRGPMGSLRTCGGPLTTAVNANGWVHCAIVQNNTTGDLTWYINGAQNNTLITTATGKGTNFTCMGYNGTATEGATGNFDDFRVYDFARTAADIAADYASTAAGVGPSGCLNPPDVGYYQCESAVNPHVGNIALGTEPAAPFTRLFTTGDTIEFSVNSPAPGPFGAVCVVNFFGGGAGSPRQHAYVQPAPLPGGPYMAPSFLPGLILGTPFSNPPLATWLLWPGTVSYGGGTPGKFTVPSLPNLGLTDGDRFDLQWVVGDSTYPPVGLGTTNTTLFEFVSPKGLHHAHVEVRGVNTINNTGFFEVWNEGILEIKQVCIDLTPITPSMEWDVAGALNSGGTLLAGTSFRSMTDVICDLTPLTNPRYTLTAANKKLCFDFLCPPNAPAGGFQGPTNHFIFDCDTNPTGNGGDYIGAIVTVTFCDNTVKMGPLIADPNDPMAAVVDF